jgi:hypothetical protein
MDRREELEEEQRIDERRREIKAILNPIAFEVSSFSPVDLITLPAGQKWPVAVF